MRPYEIGIWAPFPNEDNIKDGYFQRVKAIDNLLLDKKRIYFGLYSKKYFIPKFVKNDKRIEFHGNLFLYFIFAWLFSLLLCRIIYFHSVIESTKGFPLLFLSKFHIDLHGVVPEEMIYVNKPFLSKIFGFVESVSIRRSNRIISVTRSLLEHISNKYPFIGVKNYILLPINTVSLGQYETISTDNRSGFIYAGGIQPWQNIDKILNFSSKFKNFSGVLLVSSISKFSDTYSMQLADVREKWLVDSVSPTEIPLYYQAAKYGFLIRDDSIVNRVSCPTKMIEYLKYGVVPILEFDDIGDFKKMGIKHFKYSSFDYNFSELMYEEYAKINSQIYKTISDQYEFGVSELRASF